MSIYATVTKSVFKDFFFSFLEVKVRIMWETCSRSCLPPVPLFFMHLHSLSCITVFNCLSSSSSPLGECTISLDAIPQQKASLPTQENHTIILWRIVLSNGSILRMCIPLSCLPEGFRDRTIPEVLTSQLADLQNWSKNCSYNKSEKSPVLAKAFLRWLYLLLSPFTPKRNSAAPDCSS